MTQVQFQESTNSVPSQEAPNSIPSKDSSRCQHRFANRKRCRLSTPTVGASFCPMHAKLPEHQGAPLDLSPDLLEGLTNFQSPTDLNEFLARLLRLLAKDAIPTRRAAVMAYITNQLLRTISVIDHQEAFAEKHPTIIFDLPRPDRSEDPQDEPQMAPQT